MTISKRQFQLLNAMDIPLWVAKNPAKVKANVKPKEQVTPAASAPNQPENIKPNTTPNQTPQSASQANNAHSPIAISLSKLNSNILFVDILLSLGLTINEITTNNNQLNMGKFQWQFSENSSLSYTNNQLITPSLEVLAQSPQLKRHLWQLMSQNNLPCQ